MQSDEYPDLPFITPRAWGRGRPSRMPKLIVVHYTAGSETRTSAEDGAAWDARREDGTSCHFFHDRDTTVQCVRTTDRANSAFFCGNRIGIQHELCGTLQTRVQWLDAASYATLERAARQIARDCLRWQIPVRRIGPTEVRAAYHYGGPGGICGHVDITEAFPEDNGDHTDPGPDFPWDVLMGLIKEWTTVLTAPIVNHPEDDMGQTLTRTIPLSGADSFNFPGVGTDGATHKRPAWLNLTNSTNSARYRLRLAGWTTSGPYPLGTGGSYEVELGNYQLYSVELRPGTVGVEAQRIPIPGATPTTPPTPAYAGSLSYAVVYGDATV
jgi:N-acetylmuramoyl-L-alanine amidase